jgi:RNA polymerase sigma-70 factor (ECF subfamily)
MCIAADRRAEEQVARSAESAEAQERISAALDELPAKLRSVVVLKDVYGLPHEEIADELGITVSAAKVRLHRARRKLRDVLYDEGEAAHAV